MQKKSRKGLSVRVQLLIMSILPVIVIGAVLMTISIRSLSSGMLDEAMDGLLASAKLFREEILTTGRDLSTCELEDEYKQVTGYDFTRFEGDTRATTSVVKPDGTRPIGTQASAEVVQAVLVEGKEFTSDNTDVAGQKYCVAYAPIKDENGKVTGMAFAGKPTADIEKEISHSILFIVIIGVAIIIIVAVVVFVMASRLTKAVSVASEVVAHLSEGEFVKATEQTERKDEIGDMIRESNLLIDKLSEIVSAIMSSSNNVGESADELAQTAGQISATTDGVSEAIQEIARGATEQADNVQQATENVNTLSDAITPFL